MVLLLSYLFLFLWLRAQRGWLFKETTLLFPHSWRFRTLTWRFSLQPCMCTTPRLCPLVLHTHSALWLSTQGPGKIQRPSIVEVAAWMKCRSSHGQNVLFWKTDKWQENDGRLPQNAGNWSDQIICFVWNTVIFQFVGRLLFLQWL